MFKYHSGNNVWFEFGKLHLFELQIHSPAKMEIHVSKKYMYFWLLNSKLSNLEKLRMNENLKIIFPSIKEKKNFMKISSIEGPTNLCVFRDGQNTNW